MSHIDVEELALIALGELPQAEDASHLQSCTACRAQLDALRSVVSTSRAITADDALIAPPPGVWEAIKAEVSSTAVVPLERSRGRRRAPLWVVAAAAVGGIAAGALVAVSLPSPQAPAPVAVQARATLEPLADLTVRGSADVERGAQGAILRVSIPDLPPVDDGYYEVWMATADAQTMVAIGTLNPGGDATFVLPASMATEDFPLVDVSLEHFDGDAGHSAVSVVRGVLES